MESNLINSPESYEKNSYDFEPIENDNIYESAGIKYKLTPEQSKTHWELRKRSQNTIGYLVILGYLIIISITLLCIFLLYKTEYIKYLIAVNIAYVLYMGYQNKKLQNDYIEWEKTLKPV